MYQRSIPFRTARCLGVDRADQAQFYVNTMDHFVNVCDPQQLAYAPARSKSINGMHDVYVCVRLLNSYQHRLSPNPWNILPKSATM